MRIRVSVLACVMLLVSAGGWSQDSRLGDVAGSIKLNPDALVEKTGYVEDPMVAVKADQSLFGATLESCSTVANRLGELVEEARNTVMYRDEVLPNQLTTASVDLESEIQGIYLLRLTESLAEAEQTARAAADECRAASVSVREELQRRGVGFTEALEKVTLCRQGLDIADEQLAKAEGRVEAGVVNPSSAPKSTDGAEGTMTQDEIVASLCESERSKGDEAYAACTEAQYRAEASMASRTAANEMIDDSVFGGIRDICLALHPRDYVQRNNCELDKMTTARLDQE